MNVNELFRNLWDIKVLSRKLFVGPEDRCLGRHELYEYRALNSSKHSFSFISVYIFCKKGTFRVLVSPKLLYGRTFVYGVYEAIENTIAYYNEETKAIECVSLCSCVFCVEGK